MGRLSWLYLAGVVAAAVVILVNVPAEIGRFLASTAPSSPRPLLGFWFACAALALLFLLCESRPTELAGRSSWSPGSAATLAAAVLLGPAGAALVGTAAVLNVRRQATVPERLFNGAMYTVAGFAAGWTFYRIYGHDGHPVVPLGQLVRPMTVLADHAGTNLVTMFHAELWAFAAAAAVQVLVNHAILWGMLLADGQSRAAVRRASTVPGAALILVSDLGFAPLALVLTAFWQALGPIAAALVLVPLFAARWAMGQFAQQRSAYQSTLAALCQAVETKDFYTRGHSERVSRGAGMIASQVGMRPEKAQAVRFAGMLHDIGKLSVPTKVLQKEGPLTDQEIAAIKLHPKRGLDVVEKISFLNEALGGIMHHHERMDGRGYPMGLTGDEIPEFAKIIAVADAFDSMTSTRAYRRALGADTAVAELRKGAGTQFDPKFVEAFIAALRRERWRSPEQGKLTGEDIVTLKDHDDPTSPLDVEDP